MDTRTYEYVVYDVKGLPDLQGCFPVPVPNASACAARLVAEGYTGVAIVRETKKGKKTIVKETTAVN